MNPIAKYILALLVVLALAEVAPDVVNWILILILSGIVLKKAGAFSGLFQAIGSLGK